MRYLFETWYPAAYSDEVGSGFLARTFLEIPVMLYRLDGVPHALHDQCPHRFAPLSRGQLIDGKVRCGYHGLEFDSHGQCVGSVLAGAAPKAARIRTFPLHEKDGLIWIWMGQDQPADIATIPDLPFLRPDHRRSAHGYSLVDANYLLISDNLMDLTHVALMHPGLGGEHYRPSYKSWEDGDVVVSRYICEKLPSFLHDGGAEYLYKKDEISWSAPSNHMLDSYILPLAEAGDASAIEIPSAHLLTPEKQNSTHYFWSTSVPGFLDGMDDATVRAIFVQAFDNEDKPMIQDVQKRMGDADLWDMKPLLLAADAGAVRARRKLAAMIDAQVTERQADLVEA